MENILKNIDIKELMIQMKEKRETKLQLETDFYNSDIFKQMVQSLKDKKARVDNESFAYFPENVRKDAGWENISESHIHLFFETISNKEVGTEFIEDLSVDEEIPFHNYSFKKNGLFVDVMDGQGRIIFVKTSKDD